MAARQPFCEKRRSGMRPRRRLKRLKRCLGEAGAAVSPKTRNHSNEMTEDGKAETEPPKVIDVRDAIASAERILPGLATPEEARDPRWQAIIAIADFIQEEPDAIWSFILRWGSSVDEDLRTAIATCLLEHLLEHHFSHFFPQVEEAVRGNTLLADTFSKCWKVGLAKEEDNAKLFDRLQAECRKGRAQT